MTAATDRPQPRLCGIRVLVVEDNQVNRLVAKAILEKAGATVVMARSGLEALDKLDEARPIDVVLMDVQMPEMDGLEATRRIRAIRGLTALPIIAMTAQTASDERAACLAAGMSAHVTKPIDAGHLVDVLAGLVLLGEAAPGDRIGPNADASESHRSEGTPTAAPTAPIATAAAEDQTPGRRAATPEAGSTTPRPMPPDHDGPPPGLPGINVEAALRRLGGSKGLLLDLLRSFAGDAVGLVERLRTAIGDGRTDAARSVIHLLKGEAGNVSAEEVFNFSRGIESALRENDLLTAAALVGSLEREVTRVVRGLPADAHGGQPAPAAADDSATPGATAPLPVAPSPLPRLHPAPAATREASSPPERATVLIVDDSRLNTQTLAAILSDMCTVIIGSNGHEALSLAASHAPDLILLDVMMPGLDGYQVCTRLKGDPATAATPVIFVSAMDEEEDETRGLELGAIDYFTKPLKAPIVRARVRNHLELKRYRDLLENLSIKDALTGIANRRRLDEVLNLEWRRALRSPAPLSFVLMDIDCFKAYNDNYGHTAGDECLRRVARALSGATRRFTDLVARYGGEEFACVLPATDAAGAAILGNRLRTVVEALQIPHAHSPVTDRVTISVGVATVVPTADVPQASLTETADRRLYEAKRTGRNRVVSG